MHFPGNIKKKILVLAEDQAYCIELLKILHPLNWPWHKRAISRQGQTQMSPALGQACCIVFIYRLDVEITSYEKPKQAR